MADINQGQVRIIMGESSSSWALLCLGVGGASKLPPRAASICTKIWKITHFLSLTKYIRKTNAAPCQLYMYERATVLVLVVDAIVTFKIRCLFD